MNIRKRMSRWVLAVGMMIPVSARSDEAAAGQGLRGVSEKVLDSDWRVYAETAATYVYHEPNLFQLLESVKADRVAKGWDGKSGEVILVKLHFRDPERRIYQELEKQPGFIAFHERMLRIQRGTLMNLARQKILKPEALGTVGFAYYVNGQFYILSYFKRPDDGEPYRMEREYGAALKYIAVRYGL